MSPVTKFRKSVRMVHIMHGFGHGRRASDSSSSDSESETGPLCGMPVLRTGSPVMAMVHSAEHESDHHHVSPTPKFKSACLPRDIPHGYMAVYVGRERKRFVISTHFLSHRLFKALLKRSEEEFGFDYSGGLAIACEPVLFEHLVWLIGTNDPAARAATDSQLEDLLEFYEF